MLSWQAGQSQKCSTIMTWERGYYYRVRRQKGHVVREYVGRGRLTELAAELDAKERKKRRLDAEALRNERTKLDALDVDIESMIETIDFLAHAALMAAGLHQHKRGE